MPHEGSRTRGTASAARAPRTLAIALAAACACAFALALLIALCPAASADQTPRGPILIYGDGDFDAAHGVSAGNGSAANPYIIEGYLISQTTAEGIFLSDTTMHAIVRDVTISGPGWALSWGVYLDNAKDVTLDGITITGNPVGMQLDLSNDIIARNITVTGGTGTGVLVRGCHLVTLRDVSAKGFGCGLELSGCDNCTVVGCDATENTIGVYQGIYYHPGLAVNLHCFETSIIDCNATGGDYGLFLHATEHCTVRGCTVKDNAVNDVVLRYSLDVTMEGNQLGKGALHVIENYLSHDVKDNNTVDGMPLRYIKNRSHFTIDSDAGQIYLIGCRFALVTDLTYDGISYPVVVIDSTDCEVVNTTISGALDGICVVNADVSISRVDISDCDDGIALTGHHNLTASNLTMSSLTRGIVAEPDTLPSGDKVGGILTLRDSTLRDLAWYGIKTSSWSVTVADARIEDAVIAGIDSWGCPKAVVERSTVVNCSVGIGVHGEELELDNNTVSGCNNVGMYCTGGKDRSSLLSRDNDISDCKDGFWLQNIMNESLLEGDSISGISRDGLYVYGADGLAVRAMEVQGKGNGAGMTFVGGHRSTVSRCTVQDFAVGMDLNESSYCNVTETLFKGCKDYAIRINECSHCLLHHNNLIENNRNALTGKYKGPQAWDPSSGTAWDDGKEGNYWTDFKERYPSAHASGRVWDTPYALGGSLTVWDLWPLALEYDFHPPVAEAGADLTVGEGRTVHLDGENSTDDFGVVSYEWSFVLGGEPTVLKGMSVEFLSGPLGVLTVTLTVKDVWDNSGSDTVLVYVVDITPPVAVAGDDVTVDVGATLVLDGSRSHDDHGIVSYAWRIDPGGLDVELLGAVVRFSFTMVTDVNVVLTVMDQAENQGVGSMMVHVRDLSAPNALAGPDVTVDQGTGVDLNGSASGDNVGIVDWSWTFGYDGRTIILVGPDPSFVFEIPGLYNVTLTVKDAAGHAASDSLLVRVMDTVPPLASAGVDRTVGQDEAVGLDASGSSDNVGIANYTWTFTDGGVPMVVEGRTGTVRFKEVGTYTITLNVTDADGNWATDDVTVTVIDLTAPVAEAGADITVAQHATVTFDGRGSLDDEGITDYTWQFTEAGVAVTLQGPAPSHAFDIAGTFVVTLVVKDAMGLSATDALNVTVLDADPPVARAGPDRSVVQGSNLTIDGSASQDNVGIVEYVWTAALGGTPVVFHGPVISIGFDRQGEFKLELKVKDAAGNVAIDSLNITVLPLMVEWRLGPFLEKGGDPLSEVRVRATLNGTEYEGVTGEDGWTHLMVRRYDRISPARVSAGKAGFDTLNFTMSLDADGGPLDPVPPMVRAPGSLLGTVPIVLAAVIAAAVVVIALLYVMRKRGKA